jgi:hypothetical protein
LELNGEDDLCSWLDGACPSGRTDRCAKNFTALGGKVRSTGPGIETEEREGVEVGGESVKLLTFGVGETDKDAVLQPVKAQIDRPKALSQEIVLEALHIVGSPARRRVKTPRLGLV